MRIIIFGLSVLALLFVAALVGPSFVDWNKFKPQIISQIENATGLKVTIDGDLGLGILPTPHVSVNDITISAPKKLEFENILVMKTADISVQILPLFQKQVKIDSVKLIEPNIQVEMMADGTPSWTIEKTAKAEEVLEAPAEQILEPASQTKNDALDSISLERLEIKDGQFTYIDHRTKARHTAQEVNIVLKADSLKGPFELDGDLKVDGKTLKLEAETGKLPTQDEPLKLSAVASLPEADAKVSFSGVTSTKQPYDTQGKATIELNSPDKLAQMFGASSPIDQAITLDGLLSANQSKVQYDDLKFSLGDFVGNGKFSVENINTDNPLMVKANIKSGSVLDLDKLIKSQPKSTPQKTVNDDLQQAGKAKSASKSLVPQTLTLPMPITADVQFDISGVKFQDKQIKGVFLDLNKSGSTTKAAFKTLELPGQAKASGNVTIAYASSSQAPSTKQVTYSDPSVTYDVDGQIGQLATFFKAFAPDVDASAVTDLYKSAQFDLKGKVSGNSVSLTDSTLTLDQMVVGLAGRYDVPPNGGRAKAFIDVSAGSVNFDQIMQSQGGSNKAASNDNKSSGGQTSPKEAVKPLQNFSLPLDLGFDISLQKARINNADLEGLRLAGDLTGSKLQLSNASVNNFAGAAITLKGGIANLQNLSGMDLNLYTKTSDVKKLMSALKQDTSKLPADLNALEASASGKGSVDSMAFDTNVKAMGGQLDVAGNATDLLGTPAYSNLTIGLSHPNLVKAIQVVSPDFKSQPGLAQPITFRSQAAMTGKKIELDNMSVKLGQSDFSGNLKVDASNKVTSVRGNIKAGTIALDSLLGAKPASKSSGGSGGSPSASSSSSSSGRWSKSPIDLSFMNTMDIDVGLSAASVTYGAWNFTQPSTNLKVGNGQMTIKDMKAGVFGGQASLNTEVKASPVSLNITSNMDNIDLEKLVKALSGSGKLKSAGTVSFDVNVKATGNSANDLINALNGQANLNGTNVTLIGFDLVKLARGLATDEKLAVSAMSLVNGALSGGQTKFDTVKGDYNIQNGLVVIQSMVMDSEEAMIQSTGSADLPKWFINVDNTITLKKITDLQPLHVKIKGPLDNPTDTFGKNILEDYIQDKLKRKLTKELPGLLGDDTTKKLQQFGILPQDQAPTTTAPTDGVTPEAAPAPVEPKKIEKPEDALEQILQNPNQKPRDAVKDVLKGLF